MEQIKFAFKGETFEFDRNTLADWMSVPLRVSAKVNIHDREQAEAAFDLITSKGELPEKVTNLLAQMSPKEFAACFTVTAE